MPWMFRLTYTNPKTGIVSALEADEPEGWDAVEFTIRRSEALPGLTFTFADSMVFADKQGYQLIVQAYENDGIDAEVEAEVLWNECGTLGTQSGNEFLWRGLIDYKNYKRQRNERKVEVGLRENSFTETLLNRIETAVSLEAATSLDGQAITVVPASRIRLHGKRIFQLSAFLVNDFLKTFGLTHRMTSGGKGQNEYFDITPPWQVGSKDLDGWREPGYYEPASQNPVFFSGSDFPPGTDFRQVTVRFRLKFLFRSLSVRFETAPINTETRSYSGEYRFTIGVYDLDDNVKFETTIDAGGYDTFNADAQYDSGERNLVLAVPENCKVVMNFQWRADPLNRRIQNGRNFTLSGTFDREASFLELSEDSLYPDSTAKAYPVFDAFANLLHVATGRANAFRSDYFAIRKGLPGDPAFDGEGGLMFITNGLSLRNMRRKDGGEYPVTVSFKQLFEGLNSIFNLMMAVEYGPDNEPYVRIEPKRFFYRSQVRHAFANANDIVLRPSIEHIFSEVQVGYARWEVEKTNGLDEPNGKRTFVLPVRSQQKQLNLLSRLIAGGYLIEDTRRQQYLEKPTDDFRTDNDTFIIHCGRENSGTVSERYVSVRGDGSGTAGDSSKVFSPESAYNVQLSPVRNLLRWMDWFGGCVRRKESPAARFASGEGNYEARLFGLTENATVPVAGNFLFYPETVTFTYPLSFRAFLALQKDTIFRVGVGCGDETEYEGYILEVQYKPGTRDGGIAEFKLLRAN